MKRLSLIIILILFVGLIAFSFGGKSYIETELSKPSTVDLDSTFIVTPGESVTDIVNDLYNKNIITNKIVFLLYIKSKGLDRTIEAGEYNIPKNTNILTLSNLLQKGNFFMNITIPSGMRIEEEAEFIDKKLSINNTTKNFDKGEFISLAKQPKNFDYPFIKEIPTNQSLEGFLFPDTYQIKRNVGAQELMDKMLSAFNDKVYLEYKTLSNSTGLSFYQIITLSSLLEREVSTTKDRQMVSDILIRRFKTGFPLGLDSTIQYMLGYSASEKSWWRQTIYQVEIDRDSPYNTRMRAGFPPTPICSMEFNTVKDSVSPLANSYWYYLSDAEGNTYYSRTVEEHNFYVQKYLSK